MRVTLRDVVRVWPLRTTEQEAGDKGMGSQNAEPSEVGGHAFQGCRLTRW